MEKNENGTENQGDKSNTADKLYIWYIGITVALFGFLLVMAWIAREQGWIPNRGL